MAEADKPPTRSPKRVRCAIYTRKSSDEGLDQAFNSLDAQREACVAFIQSQKHEGWRVLPTQYDDGGYSGGTLDRPALKRLLADTEAGQIDAIIVYKVDRLTRALSDFAKLVEIFERRGVSFVSITQQFNTTTSMGRLTLNVLLSFAQFEREVIGERVRDKIAASKKKGMWMGGMPPLGYDVKDRQLAVNPEEARTVVAIYQRYLALKSVRELEEDLARAGVRSKRRSRSDGSTYGAQKLSRGALYLMLQNRIYRGEVTHKGNSYPGQHPAIVEQTLWDGVQAARAKNRGERISAGRRRDSSLLTGSVFDQRGQRLTPTYAIKKGTRYRYYVSASLITRGRSGSSGLRIPAGDLEALVTRRLSSFFADPAAVLDALDQDSYPGLAQTQLIERAHHIADELGTNEQNKAKTVLAALACRVEIRFDQVKIELSRQCVAALLAGKPRDMTSLDPDLGANSDDVIILSVPARLKRVGREMKMVLDNADERATPDPSLLRIIARAHDVQARLNKNSELAVHDIAREERVTAAYIYTLLRLPWLAPDITAAIVTGRQPSQLNAMTLMRKASRLPVDWREQRTLLGFR